MTSPRVFKVFKAARHHRLYRKNIFKWIRWLFSRCPTFAFMKHKIPGSIFSLLVPFNYHEKRCIVLTQSQYISVDTVWATFLQSKLRVNCFTYIKLEAAVPDKIFVVNRPVNYAKIDEFNYVELVYKVGQSLLQTEASIAK